MQPRIALLNLGVDDLQKAVRFYRDGLDQRPRALSGHSSSMAQSPPALFGMVMTLLMVMEFKHSIIRVEVRDSRS